MTTLHCYQIFYIVTNKPGLIFVQDDFGNLVAIDFSLQYRFFQV